MIAITAATDRVEQVIAAQATAVDRAKTETRTRVAWIAEDTARRKPEICFCSKYHIQKV